jgi:hypothetical protein
LVAGFCVSTGLVGCLDGAVVGTGRVSGGGGAGVCDTCVLVTHAHFFGGVVLQWVLQVGRVVVVQWVLQVGRDVVVQFDVHTGVVVLCVDGVVVGCGVGFLGGFGGTQVRPAIR